MVVSELLHAPATLPRTTKHRYPLNKVACWAGTTAGLRDLERKTIPYPCPESNHDSFASHWTGYTRRQQLRRRKTTTVSRQHMNINKEHVTDACVYFMARAESHKMTNTAIPHPRLNIHEWFPPFPDMATLTELRPFHTRMSGTPQSHQAIKTRLRGPTHHNCRRISASFCGSFLLLLN